VSLPFFKSDFVFDLFKLPSTDSFLALCPNFKFGASLQTKLAGSGLTKFDVGVSCGIEEAGVGEVEVEGC
jgi:hypothetical protein